MQDNETVSEVEGATATLTRKKVASMLGVSVATVRRMEGKSLHPRRVAGAWLFEMGEVAAIPKASRPTDARDPSEGALIAELFRCFDKGQSFRQVVRESRQAPDLVRAAYRQWSTPLGEIPEQAPEVDVLARRDEHDLVRWEDQMRAMEAADERKDREDRLERKARREHRGPFLTPTRHK
jgi:hypothetical protein